MAEAKQAQLNGAYYGPSIPAPSKSYHRPGRGGGGCCCCNPFSCLMNCLCTCVFQILCTILVILGIVVLVCWLIFRPNPVKFYATDASLAEFNLQNNTLRYNLAVNLTIRNPNRRIGIYYDRMEASAYYHGQRLSSVDLGRFYQGRKNTSYVNAQFSGTRVVVLGNRERSAYTRETNSGMYEIDVKLSLRSRLKIGVVRSPRVKPKIDCDLRVPFSANGTPSSGTYQPRRCDFDWR